MVELHLGDEADLIGVTFGRAGNFHGAGGHVDGVTVAIRLENDVFRNNYAFVIAGGHIVDVVHVDECKCVAGFNTDAGISGRSFDGLFNISHGGKNFLKQ